MRLSPFPRSFSNGCAKLCGRKRRSVRLLVPTATLARHLQNRIAQRGFRVPPQPDSDAFGIREGPGAGDAPQVSDAALYLMVEEARRGAWTAPEFARVAGMPGFCASLARTMAEFSSAGCDSARLAAPPSRCAAGSGLPGGVPGSGPRAGTRAAWPCAPGAWNWRRHVSSSRRHWAASRPSGWMAFMRCPIPNCGVIGGARPARGPHPAADAGCDRAAGAPRPWDFARSALERARPTPAMAAGARAGYRARGRRDRAAAFWSKPRPAGRSARWASSCARREALRARSALHAGTLRHSGALLLRLPSSTGMRPCAS